MSRTPIITGAIVAVVLIYLFGVGTGLIASSIFKEAAEERIAGVESKARDFERSSAEQIEALESSVVFLQDLASTLQIEEVFSETLSDEDRCVFASSVSSIFSQQLEFYREELPYRLESYPAGSLSNAHATLKERYDALSIRVWVLLRRQAMRCEEMPEPILYLYTRGCEPCVAQGEILDELDQQQRGSVFAIDLESEDALVRLIAEHYAIRNAPALVIHDTVLFGPVPIERIEEEIR